MPNWVTNRIRIEGKDALSVLSAHLTKDESGQEAFDFNTIERMPEALNIEKKFKVARRPSPLRREDQPSH